MLAGPHPARVARASARAPAAGAARARIQNRTSQTVNRHRSRFGKDHTSRTNRSPDQNIAFRRGECERVVVLRLKAQPSF